MALSRPFLTGTILFSSISPDYERNLKDELFACFKHIGIPFDVLEKMPIRDRRFYIYKYNDYVKKQEDAYEASQGNSTPSADQINAYARMSQGHRD